MVPSTNNRGTDPKGTNPLPPLPKTAPTGRAPLPTPTGGHVVIRPLRTYKDDLAEAIKKGGYSTASIQEAERKKKERAQVATPPPQRPAGVQPKPPKPTPTEEPRVAHATRQSLPPQPLPPSPTPAQIPPVSQRSGEERKTFFSQLLGHKKAMNEQKPEEKPLLPQPPHKESPTEKPQEKPAPIVTPAPHHEVLPVKPASIPTPPKVQTPPRVPNIPVPDKVPVSTTVTGATPRDEVRFVEEHAVEKKGFPSNLPAWAVPGETGGERRAEEQARQEKAAAVVAPVFKPHLPLVTREAPTRGSAVSKDSPAHPHLVRSITIALLSVIAIFGVGFGGYTLYKKYPFTINPVEPFVGTSQFISATEIIPLDVTGLSGESFPATYRTKEQEMVAAQSIRSIIATVKETGAEGKITTRALTTSEFFTLAVPTAPGILVRALGEIFTSGVHGSIGGNGGFVIAPVENYDRALSGLLEWEPNMGTTIAPLLLSKASSDVRFTDKTINGVPVRVLGSGKEALVYGLIDKKLLLIARGEDAFGVLVGVIRTSK